MSYDGRFRFRSIDPKRFYDAPLIAFIAVLSTIIAVQVCLFAFGKSDLRTMLKTEGTAFAQNGRAMRAGGHDQN